MYLRARCWLVIGSKLASSKHLPIPHIYGYQVIHMLLQLYVGHCYCSRFTDEETEAQTGQVAYCPWVVEPRVEQRCFDTNIRAFSSFSFMTSNVWKLIA